jgi:hypothetical protein
MPSEVADVKARDSGMKLHGDIEQILHFVNLEVRYSRYHKHSSIAFCKFSL